MHGARVKGRYDGHPIFNRVHPGASFTHYYPNEQEAITMWYHDHNIMDTGLHVWSGMAAFYLLTDDHEQALINDHALPAEPFDVPIVIQDKAFNADGTIRYIRDTNEDPLRQGMFGDIMLVNGQPYPKMTVEPRKYRFRILNGCNARFMNLRLSTGDAFSVVQTDGGFIPRRADTTDLFIAMAERYSVVIDFAKYAGQRVVLQNTVDPDPFGDPVPKGHVNEIMAFDVIKPKSAIPDVTVPDVLNEWKPWLQDIKSVGRREFRFERGNGQWVINGQPYLETRMDAEPVLNTTEIWTVTNNSGAWLHPIHMHLVEYRMLERNGRPVKNYEQGPKDVIALGPNESVKAALHFDGDDQWFDDADVKADPAALVYPMHCHNLEHEDHDMMAQFRMRRS
jgi:FtsP/CotA-like multicopper oxidase with cupredoxin domain